MNPGHALTMTHCPNCGARIVPTPREFKQWREAAGLTQRKIAVLLKISAAHVAYLEQGRRSPSGLLIERYQRFRALAHHASVFTLTERQRQVTELRSAGLYLRCHRQTARDQWGTGETDRNAVAAPRPFELSHWRFQTQTLSPELRQHRPPFVGRAAVC
jgi:transcriptional regulator with XRE-family HTH domain